jgi:hypothetical protein
MNCLARRTEIVRTTTQVTFAFTNQAGALGLACRVTKPAGSRFASLGDKDRCCFRSAAAEPIRSGRPRYFFKLSSGGKSGEDDPQYR